MDSMITLPNRLYQRLVLKSQQLKRTPDEVVADLVQQYLKGSDNRWQNEFQALLARVRTRTTVYTPAEIEADITAAATEVKKLRHARRST